MTMSDAKIDLLLDELRRNPEKAAEIGRRVYESGVTVDQAAEALQRAMRAGSFTLEEASVALSRCGEVLQSEEEARRERDASVCVDQLLNMRTVPVVRSGSREAGLLLDEALREANSRLRRRGFLEFEAVEGRPGEVVVQRRAEPAKAPGFFERAFSHLVR
jgi:hypothetical protein